MTNGVFTDDAPPAPAETPAVPEDYAARLAAKDAFIDQLKLETAELRKEAEEKARLEDMLEEARRNAAAPKPAPLEAKPAASEQSKPLDEAELVERVIKAQEARQGQAKATANVQTTADRLVELYGSEDAAAKVVATRAAELGVDKAFLMKTAAQSPAAFYELMKLQTAPTQAPAPRSDVNTAAFASHAQGVKEGTEAYYEKLRKDMGASFYTPKIQNQRMKDRLRLGDSYYT